MIPYPLKHQIKNFIKRNYIMVGLIALVVAIALALWTIGLFSYIKEGASSNYINHLRWLSSELFAPLSFNVFTEKPWTFATSFLSYTSVLQLIIDAFLLLIAGNMFVEFFSAKQMWMVLLWSHFCAFLLFATPTSIFPQLDSGLLVDNNIGLSGAAYGLLFSVIAVKPKQTIPIFKYRISMQTVGLIFLALTIATLNKHNFLMNAAHIGGMVGGVLFGFSYAKKWLPLKRNRKMKYTYGKGAGKPLSDEEYNTKRANDQKRTDLILDKISKAGYENLSSEEKEFLFKYKRK